MKRAVLCALVLTATMSGCELEVPIGRLPPAPRALSGTGAIDILVVLDNSGSMAEEQEQLSRTLYKEECPIQDLGAVPEALQNPTGHLLEELEDLCGFAQILAAYQRDFRVGVITTDVNACDNAAPLSQGGEGWSRPQRGCLQPVPETGQKVIAREDTEIADKFIALIGAIGTYGSPYERGLDAADLFLAGRTFQEECQGDLELLRRPDADLLLVFVTDEDDCSHSDGRDGWDDETLEQCGEDYSLFTEHSPDACYQYAEYLVPVGDYAERFLGYAGAGHLSVLVVGGATPTDRSDDRAPHEASGCYLDSLTGFVDSECFESRGLSSYSGSGPNNPCGPDTVAERGGLPCCTADAASRYQELTAHVDGVVRSICAGEYVNAVSRALEQR